MLCLRPHHVRYRWVRLVERQLEEQVLGQLQERSSKGQSRHEGAQLTTHLRPASQHL